MAFVFDFPDYKRTDGNQFFAHYISAALDLSNQRATNQTLGHELGHSFGLIDQYTYGGMDGEAGTEPMNQNCGDFCSWSKLALNWFDMDNVQVYTGGKQTFTLKSLQEEPDVLMIPNSLGDPEQPDNLKQILSSCLLVELNTREHNLSDLIQNSGVRVLRCYNRDFTLVNNGNGYFHAGDIMNSETPGLGYYSQMGISVIIDEIKDDGTCTVTVTGPEYKTKAE